MAENMDFTALQKQIDGSKDDSKLPRWWEGQKQDWGNQLTQLETKIEENQGYMRRIISLLSKEVDDTNQVTVNIQVRNDGKKPVQLTIIDEREKYSMNLGEPGILAPKPQAPPNHPMALKSQNTEKLKLGDGPMELGATSVIQDPYLLERNHPNSQGSDLNTFTLRPKIKLQLFAGDNPRSWVRKCQAYFSIFGIPECQKIEIAAMYLTGKAETWFDGYIMQKHKTTWHEFTTDLCYRFCDKTYFDVVEEVNKLMQKSTVEEYQERFEELKPYMLMHNPHLEESYFVSSFISGLKEDIKHRVRVHEQRVLADAYRKAKLHELSLEIEGKTYRYTQKTYST